jgi:hypothetical protein
MRKTDRVSCYPKRQPQLPQPLAISNSNAVGMQMQFRLQVERQKFRALGFYNETSLLKSRSGPTLPEVPHLLLVLRHLLFERFAPSFMIGNLAQRFAFLLTFPDGLSRVAERKDREDRNLLGNTQQGVDLQQAVEANPV